MEMPRKKGWKKDESRRTEWSSRKTEISQIYSSSHDSASFETRFCSESQNPSVRATELVFDGSKLEIDSDQFSSGSLACICRIKGNPDDTRTLTFSLKSHNEVTEREDEDCGHRLEIAVHGAVHEFNCSENEWQVENFALDNVSIALFVEVPINKSMDYELSIQVEEEFLADISCWLPTSYVDHIMPTSTKLTVTTTTSTDATTSNTSTVMSQSATNVTEPNSGGEWTTFNTSTASSTTTIVTYTNSSTSSAPLNPTAQLTPKSSISADQSMEVTADLKAKTDSRSTSSPIDSTYQGSPNRSTANAIVKIPTITTSSISSVSKPIGTSTEGVPSTTTVEVFIGGALAAGLCLGVLILVIVICCLRKGSKKKKRREKKRKRNNESRHPPANNYHGNHVHANNYHDNYVEPNNFHGNNVNPNTDRQNFDTGEYSTISEVYSYPTLGDFPWAKDSGNRPGYDNEETRLKQIMDLSEGYSLARIPKEAKHVGEIDIRSVNSYLRPMSKADMLTTVDRKNGYIQLSAD